MESLQQAADLDLLRPRTAIDLRQSPARIPAVRVHMGREVHYWDLREHRMQHGMTRFNPIGS